jgi:hypothetical protein
MNGVFCGSATKLYNEKNWGTEGKFSVSVEGEISTPREMQAGVPQVSVLSPALFNTYTNGDLNACIPSQMQLIIFP